MRHITRIDLGHTKGWWVRFQRQQESGGKPVTSSRLFSDSKYGGQRRALRFAMLWRDMKVSQLPPPRHFAASGSGREPKPIGYLRVSYRTKRCVQRNGERKEVAIVWAHLKVADELFVEATRSVDCWGRDGAKRRAIRDVKRKRDAILG